MLSSVLHLGLKSLDTIAAAAAARRASARVRHPLAAYPRLQAMLVEAEYSGALADERRRLIRNQTAFSDAA